MKKLITTVAVLGCAVAMVSAQTVTSANIVGYSKTIQPSGEFVLAAPGQFSGTAGGITLSNAFSGVVGGEKVYVFNGSAYDIYEYYAGYGWFDGLGNPGGAVVLPEGESVWLTGVAGAVTIMAGEVPSADSVTNAVVAGFNLISDPYPVELAVADIDVSGFVGEEKIYVFNGSAYDIYTYYAGYGWFDGLGNPAGSVKIPVGEGFWLSAVNSGSLVFNKPF